MDSLRTCAISCIALVLMFTGVCFGDEVVLSPPDGTKQLLFGHSVVPVGNKIIVGSPAILTDDDPGIESGPVYIYSDSKQPRLLQVLEPLDSSGRAIFGAAISATDDLLVVGAPMPTRGAEDGSVASVCVYELTDAGYDLQQQITSPQQGKIGRGFGWHVLLHGDSMFVSAHGYRNDEQTGAVYVYQRVGTSYELVQMLQSSSPQRGDNFGGCLTAAGDRVFISAPGHGHVEVFDSSEGEWHRNETIKPANADECEDQFGLLVSAHRDWLALSTVNGVSATQPCRSVRLFRLRDGRYEQVQRLTSPTSPERNGFGLGHAFANQRLYIGQPQFTGPIEEGDGAVYVYELRDGRWMHTETIRSKERATGFGYRIVPLHSGRIAFSSDFGERIPGTDVSGESAVHLFTCDD